MHKISILCKSLHQTAICLHNVNARQYQQPDIAECTCVHMFCINLHKLGN